MKLGCQSEPSTEEHFAFFARYGIHNVCAKPETSGGRLYSTVEELEKLKAMGARHELAIDMVQPILLPSSHIDREAHPAIMLADSPERDRDIEAFQTLIRNCAKAGIPAIKYNMSLLGVLRVGDVPGRGDVRYLEWDAATAKPKTPLTKAGPVNADAFWERITYFLDRVVPVANEYKVRIACHPHDPGVPPSGYQGIDRVLGTIDGLKRFVSIRESAYHGLNFCQGTISEDLADPNTQIHDVIRWFGTRKKIFNVHFRNIRGHRDKFLEVYPDEGSVDMVRALETYREVGYDGMIMPDHVPEVPGDNGGARLASFAFCYGYIRGLMQSAERLA
ncbi:TIM barrel protein [Sphingomonas sp. AP4-R1]|nr:TIM barrel protein [Sphingomonas sp. AP4-R1]